MRWENSENSSTELVGEFRPGGRENEYVYRERVADQRHRGARGGGGQDHSSRYNDDSAYSSPSTVTVTGWGVPGELYDPTLHPKCSPKPSKIEAKWLQNEVIWE